MVSFPEIIEYFTNPTATAVYTLPKTLVYALVLIGAIYLIYEILKRLNVKIDRRLAFAIAPFVLFGGTIRVLRDAGFSNSYWLVTPGIYMFVFAVTIIVLLLAIFLERKKQIPYHKFMFLIGLTLFAVSLTFFAVQNLEGSIYAILFFLPFLAGFYFFKKWNVVNRLVASVQMFDATTTYVAVGYGKIEEHVLPTFFITNFDPLSFVFVKLVGIVAILFLIDRFSSDKNFNLYLKLLIGILGGATSSRDFVLLTALR